MPEVQFQYQLEHEGQTITYNVNPQHREKDNPNKIKSVRLLTLDGKKLNMKRRYRVVTNSYVPATSVVPKGAAHEQNVQTTDVLIQFLKKQQKVNYLGRRSLIFK